MKLSAPSSSMIILAASISIVLVTTVATAPLMESEDEDLAENSLVGPEEGDGADWDSINVADLRKLLLQLDTQNRMMRVSRSWPAGGAGERRGGGGGWSRALGRQIRPWRADKRQVRFRQCYFNPISCFK